MSETTQKEECWMTLVPPPKVMKMPEFQRMQRQLDAARTEGELMVLKSTCQLQETEKEFLKVTLKHEELKHKLQIQELEKEIAELNKKLKNTLSHVQK